MDKTIFLVDHESRTLSSLQTLLEIVGFHVEIAADEQGACERVHEGAQPDVLITDIDTPAPQVAARPQDADPETWLHAALHKE